MPKYHITAALSADAGTIVEADSAEQAYVISDGGVDALDPMLCAECASKVNLGDPIGFVVSDEAGKDVIDTTPQSVLRRRITELETALRDLFDSYKDLGDCGDCGNWRIEDAPEGKAAMRALGIEQ